MTFDKALTRLDAIRGMVAFVVTGVVGVTVFWVQTTGRISALELRLGVSETQRLGEDERLGRIERNLARVGEKLGVALENPR